MGNELSTPVDNVHTHFIRKGHLTVSVASMHGRREHNEDSYCLEEVQPGDEKKATTSQEMFSAVYDGHCGKQVARLLPKLFIQSIRRTGFETDAQIEKACLECDEELLKLCETEVKDAGSCAAFCIIGNPKTMMEEETKKPNDEEDVALTQPVTQSDEDTEALEEYEDYETCEEEESEYQCVESSLKRKACDDKQNAPVKKQRSEQPRLHWPVTIANVGDSRTMVIDIATGNVVFVTKDHKPGNKEERERIEKCEGFVENGRVNGYLAVARAFGDFPYKDTKNQSLFEQQIIAKPTIHRINVHSGQCLLQLCDGYFERLDNATVASFVAQKLRDGEKEEDIMQQLTRKSLDAGSGDNMTGILTCFSDVAHPTAINTKHFILGTHVPGYGELDNTCGKSFLSDVALAGIRKDILTREIRQRIHDRTQQQIATQIRDEKRWHEQRLQNINELYMTACDELRPKSTPQDVPPGVCITLPPISPSMEIVMKDRQQRLQDAETRYKTRRDELQETQEKVVKWLKDFDSDAADVLGE